MQALTERFIGRIHEDCDGARRARADHEPRATEYVPADRRHGAGARRQGLRLRGAQRRRVLRRGEVRRRTAGSRASGSTTCAPARASRSTRPSAIRSTSRSGRRPSPASPRGNRRGARGGPGWHIECSAMSRGPPRASSSTSTAAAWTSSSRTTRTRSRRRAACDRHVRDVWMHNGFVRVDDEKMSKSLGNFFTIRDVLGGCATRRSCAISSSNSQYRGPINYSPDRLTQADAALERLYIALRGVTPQRTPVEHRRARSASRGDGRRFQYARGARRNANPGAGDQYGKGGGRRCESGAGRDGIVGARQTALAC